MDKRKKMSEDMKFEMKMANLRDRIKGPSVTGLFLPRIQTRSLASHFMSSTPLPVFHLEMYLTHQSILLAECVNQYKIMFTSLE